MKEMVGQRVLFRFGGQRESGRVVVTHCQAERIADDYKSIHAPTIYLRLLLVIPVNEIARRSVAWNETLNGERSVWKIRRQMRIRRLGQDCIRLSRKIELPVLLRAQPADPIRSVELTVKVVEAPVLEVGRRCD